jgi:DNA-binding transcriptional LysR family regulator
MKNLSLDDFALFAQLATAQSLSAVARERNVAASHMSRALARMEAQCGLRLVHRTTHSVSLTNEGEIFLEHAQRILAEQRLLQDSFGSRSQSVVGTVRVSISQLLAEYVLIPCLGKLRALHPELVLDLHVDDRVVSMADEAMDVAVRAGVAPAETSIARTLGSHGRALYASPGYLKKYGLPRKPGDLLSHSLISNTASPAHNRWLFKEHGRLSTTEVLGQVRVNSSAAVVCAAVAGAGIARVNDVVGKALVDQGRLKPVLERYTVTGNHLIHAVILAERNRAPKIRATLDYLQACFADFSSHVAESESGLLAKIDHLA